MKNSRQRIIWLSRVALTALAISISSPRTAAETAQQNSASATSTAVPRLIKSSGTLLDEQGHPLKSPVGVTFALYAQQSGGAALWLETQNVEPDANGNYSVLLGVASANGVPAELFSSGEARWLGVQAERQPEQPRVLLVSVPYALKAGDAQTLGGLPANAFALAGTPSASTSSSSSTTNIVTAAQPTVTAATIGGTGTTDFIPLWTGSTTLGNSILFQAPTSNSIGIGTTAPAAKLDVNGGATIRGQLSLPFTGTATSTLAFNSQPLDLLASAFNSSTHAAVPQSFRWQAEPVGNNSTSPSGKLNLLFASGTATPAETGLSVSNTGIITFAPGQTLPTVTGNETVNGNLSTTGSVSVGDGLVANGSGFAMQGHATGTGATSVGVSGTATASTGIGVEGTSLTTTGSGVGVQGMANSPSGVAGLLRNIGGGLLLKGLDRFGTSTVFSVDSSGNVFGSGTVQGTVVRGTGNGFVPGVNGFNVGFGNGVVGSGGHNGGTGVVGTGGSGGPDGGTGVFGQGGGSGAGVIGQGGFTGDTTGVEGFGEGNGTGVEGVGNGSRGVGVFGVEPSPSNTAKSLLGNVVTGVWGDVNRGATTGEGVLATADDTVAILAQNNSILPAGLFKNLVASATPIPVLQTQGSAGQGCTIDTAGNLTCNGNAQQDRSVSGWVKAMAVIDETISPVGPNQIVRCYNSQVSGAASSTTPCGFNMTLGRLGAHDIDFGFQISDRFIQATPVFTSNLSNSGGVVLNLFPISSSRVEINTFYNGSGDLTDTTVYVLVF